jgi:hypothetical protein
MNGRQLAERMIADRPALRVLFTSGYAYGAVHAQGRTGQGIPMLTKPLLHKSWCGCCAAARSGSRLRGRSDPAADSAPELSRFLRKNQQ